MQKNLIITSLMLALVLATVPPAHATTTQEVPYIAGEAVGIWCAPGGHAYVPGDPSGHDDPFSWLLSGEPECLAPDLVFGTDSGGSIGYVFIEDATDLLSWTVADAFFDPQVDETVHASGSAALWIHAAYLDADSLDVKLGSTGTVTLVFA